MHTDLCVCVLVCVPDKSDYVYNLNDGVHLHPSSFLCDLCEVLTINSFLLICH